MDLAASRNPFQTIILTLALFMGGLGRCIHYREERTASPQPLLAAVQARLDAMFSRIHRALLA